MEDRIIEFRAEGVIRKIQSMSDKGMRVIIDTQELQVHEAAALHSYVHQHCGLVLTKSERLGSTVGEAPTIVLEDEEKSPSKRLRDCLFVLWKHNGEKGDFEAYYRTSMNAFISAVKAKLPEQ